MCCSICRIIKAQKTIQHVYSHSARAIHAKTLHNAVTELEKKDEEEEEEIE